MSQPVFRGRIANGKLQLDKREEFAALRERLEGAEIELVLRRKRKLRTNAENRRLHAILGIMAMECGCTPAEMKEAVKWELAVRYTSEQTTVESSRLMSDVLMLAAWMGIVGLDSFDVD